MLTLSKCTYAQFSLRRSLLAFPLRFILAGTDATTCGKKEDGPQSNSAEDTVPRPTLLITCLQTRQSYTLDALGNFVARSVPHNQQKPSAAAFPRTPESTHVAPISSLRHTLRQQIIATFFPSGYPSTVAPGYLRYTLWQALHHAAGSANGVLASSFLLYAVGLGPGALPTAGALNWVLKDGLGQAGTLLFGRFMAHNFDVATRTWYVAASAKLNLAMGLEIATFLLPHAFLPLGAAANAVKGLAWMAGGSSRSTFNVAFAADSNIADITAKATSQTICTSLLGTTAGLALAANIEQSASMAFGCYGVLAAVHMWSSWESARCVPLATLNPSRLALLAHAAVGVRYGDGGCGCGDAVKLPTPSQLATQDPVLPSLFSKTTDTAPALQLRFVGCATMEELLIDRRSMTAAVLPLYRERRYILFPEETAGSFCVVLHADAGARDVVLAALHAAAWYNDSEWNEQLSDGGKNDSSTSKQAKGVAVHALQRADELVDPVLNALKHAGWESQRVVVEAIKRRAVW